MINVTMAMVHETRTSEILKNKNIPTQRENVLRGFLPFYQKPAHCELARESSVKENTYIKTHF